MSGEQQHYVDALLSAGLIREEQVAQLVEFAQSNRLAVPLAAVQLLKIDSQRVKEAITAGTQADWSDDISGFPVDDAAAALISRARSEQWDVVPLVLDGDVLVMAGTLQASMSRQVGEDLQLLLNDKLPGCVVRWVTTSRAGVAAKRETVYRNDSHIQELTDRVTEGGSEAATKAATEAVNLYLDQAIRDKASDIHFEPSEYKLHVRYRIDGVLHDKAPLPVEMRSAVSSRLKVMADIDIADRMKPTDGQLQFALNGRRVDMRVATIPTVHGEKVTLRILDNSGSLKQLSQLGFSRVNGGLWREGYTKPHGLILATGPTGSGKSTTLYATLNEIATVERNIITIEDPVEYRLPRINQVAVNRKAGMTFASGLRSILRHDPDVVLVGEIRDRETAQIAIEAALTGHLVLSTLHTNSAPEAAVRLTEMGVEPYLVTSVLESVLAQRLVRKLCESCKRPVTVSPAELEGVGFAVPAGVVPTFYRAVGCGKCTAGFKGRVAVHEVLRRHSSLEQGIVRRVGSQALGDIATRDVGMVPMRTDGWLKVAAGITTINEVLRVTA